jgi:hypothetical protein
METFKDLVDTIRSYVLSNGKHMENGEYEMGCGCIYVFYNDILLGQTIDIQGHCNKHSDQTYSEAD